MTADEFACAAEALVGTRFRLHGRDPATGLDCIGLFAAALAACGRTVTVPDGYGLRTRDPARLLPLPEACGFMPAHGDPVPGDAQLLRLGPAQAHLAIVLTGPRHVHAHAGLRRVAISTGLPAGEVLHHWRPAATS